MSSSVTEETDNACNLICVYSTCIDLAGKKDRSWIMILKGGGALTLYCTSEIGWHTTQ